MMNILRNIINKINLFISKHGCAFILIIGVFCSLIATICNPGHWYVWIPLAPLWGYCALFLLSPLAFMLHAITVKKDDCKNNFQWIAYKMAFLLMLAVILFVIYNTFFNRDEIQKTMESLEPYPYYEDYDDDFRFGRPGH